MFACRAGRRLLARALIAILVAFLATVSALHLFLNNTKPRVSEVPGLLAGSPVADSYQELAETVEPAPPSVEIRLNLDETTSLAAYLVQAGLCSSEAKLWESYFRQTARTSLLRKDHPITLYKDPETGALRGLKYDVDESNAVSEATLGPGIIKAFGNAIQYATKPVSVAFPVKEGFRTAARQSHVPEPVIDTLEREFSTRCKLDRLTAGSVVKVIYEERVSRDGVYHLAGNVQAAEIRNGTETIRAFAFRDEHGRDHLYDETGRALEPQFLRFPVNFKYISSGFSLHRYHPILGVYRPHVGVDLVARYGTPVKAIADGRVETAGWCGELGNCVRIEHANRLSSIYGHLARIGSGVRAGSNVRMGQVIGSVGSSGLSTGAHLHFALERSGRPVNPLTQKLGVNHEISPRMRALFEQLRRHYQLTLAELAPNPGSRVAASEGGVEPSGFAASPSDEPAVVKIAASTRHRLRHRRRWRHRARRKADSAKTDVDAL